MIDFISTRQSIDAETAACARLIAAVIGQAIKDAAQPLTAEEKKIGHIGKDQKSAVRFLFGADSPFQRYAELIDIPADRIRAALLKTTDDMAHDEFLSFRAKHRKAIKWRLDKMGIRWPGDTGRTDQPASAGFFMPDSSRCAVQRYGPAESGVYSTHSSDTGVDDDGIRSQRPNHVG